MNTQTDYDKNCAVAEKLGYTPDHDHRNYPQVNGVVSNAVMWYEGKSYHSADYCNDPRDYMPIAIEHGIAIDFNRDKSTVYAVFSKYNSDIETYSPDDYIFSEELSKDKTGHAVVDAFLAMDITTNES